MALRKGSRPAKRSAPKLKKAPRPASARGMTVQEAGRLGGLVGGRKGGLRVRAERGIGFFQEIGRRGGERVRDLIAAGRRATERGGARRAARRSSNSARGG